MLQLNLPVDLVHPSDGKAGSLYPITSYLQQNWDQSILVRTSTMLPQVRSLLRSNGEE
jgi:hypothetical protein